MEMVDHHKTPCYDSSPQFIAEVEAIVCEGYDFSNSNNNVFDYDTI